MAIKDVSNSLLIEIKALTLFECRDVGAEVDVPERARAYFAAQPVLVANPKLHCGWKFLLYYG